MIHIGPYLNLLRLSSFLILYIIVNFCLYVILLTTISLVSLPNRWLSNHAIEILYCTVDQEFIIELCMDADLYVPFSGPELCKSFPLYDFLHVWNEFLIDMK
jgi:hypothetical protein